MKADVKKYTIPPRWDLKEVHDKGINGDGITIAVLDSTININHKAFSANTPNGKNFIEGKRQDYWYTNRNSKEHGTMVTGTVTKYAPKAEIFVCCVSEKMNYIPEAIIKALDHLKKSFGSEEIEDKKKCQVIVMSVGHYKPKEDDSKRKELINELASKGVIFVAATGNYGVYADNIAFPASLDSVIAVGGLKKDGYEPATFNSPGPIDVYAPGEDVCVPSHTDDSTYQKVAGTSFAAPAIGGIIALLLQLAHKSGIEINNVELVKRILSHMKEKVKLSMPNGRKEEVVVFSPKKFFCEYDTPDKFKALIETIQSSV